MKLYRYSYVYSYGDCEEEILIKANSIEEAKCKLLKFKNNDGYANISIKDADIKEISFDDSGICVV